ncbi:MAG TPA: hypothetical protein VN493_07520 [Thermoanaerobaculia bacterium]|nr:hypothetical protein [Thermoanaerobaculia bacterium]
MRPSRALVSPLIAVLLLAACRKEPAAPSEFKPPADGRLTEEQVQTYLDRAERMQPAEREWVTARVREARMAGVSAGIERKITDSRRQILRSLEERRRTLKDPAKQAEVDRQIAEVRRLLQGAPPEVPPVVRDNAELLARMEKEP